MKEFKISEKEYNELKEMVKYLDKYTQAIFDSLTPEQKGKATKLYNASILRYEKLHKTNHDKTDSRYPIKFL